MSVAFAILLVGGLVGTYLSTGAAGASSGTPPFGVAISDSPAVTDPYLIEFNVTVASGSPTWYAWDFGDGQFSNGSGPGYASPAHRYAGPGNFTVDLAVSEGALVSQQNLPLSVAPAPLRVAIAHSASPGSLTETFTATVVGGSGSYPSVLWSFGDGGTGSGRVIRYTYQHPGTFVATLNVSDSAGHTASTQATINATGTGPIATGESSVSPALIAALLAVGAAGLVGSIAAIRWATRRAIAHESIEIVRTPGAGSPVPESRPPIPRDRPPGPPNVGTLLTEVTGASPAPPEGDIPPAPAGPSPARASVRKEALRTSQRIVLHLWALGSLAADEVAPLGFSQKGIAEALAVSQNALTNVLRRLVAGGVLVEDVRHVQGQPRRLKVYRLTPRGEALARDLRRSGPGPAGGKLPPSGERRSPAGVDHQGTSP